MFMAKELLIARQQSIFSLSIFSTKSNSSGLLGMEMQKYGSEFYGGDGIVKKGVENTIDNVSRIAREGMRETDKTIIEIMTEKVSEGKKRGQ